MVRISNDKLRELQHVPQNIRHVCILAHVDHGKTTVADLLLATNGIINTKMAGQLRFLDDRSDEQRRGITMKSSAVALYYLQPQTPPQEYLINFIDSPGHIDFSVEVLSAARISDGALIIVDAVEGVCAQTLSCLEIAYEEKVKMILVINKIDRLILEKMMSPLEIFLHISQILETMNAAMAEIKFRDYALRIEDEFQNSPNQVDDEFQPELKNVIFASAVDGWAFRLYEFAVIYRNQLNKSEEWLEKNLWEDCYYDKKTQEFLYGARQENKKPLFVTLILENICALYEHFIIHRNPDKISKIIEKMQFKKKSRDMNSSVPRTQLRAVISEWLPFSEALLSSIVQLVSSPTSLCEDKVKHIVRKNVLNAEEKLLESKIASLISSCSFEKNTPVIAYISKFITVNKADFNHSQIDLFTDADIAIKRQIVAQRKVELNKKLESPKDEEMIPIPESTTKIIGMETPDANSNIDFIACVRVFSGILETGSELYLLPPVYVGNMENDIDLKDDLSSTIKKIPVTELYLLRGRDMIPIENAVAGNIVGIGNLSKYMVRTGTLSSTLECISLIEKENSVEPFYRTAVEPRRPTDIPKLTNAIKLMMQSDSCVQCILQENGQYVLLTAGDVHLGKCLEDLKRFTDIPFTISEPIVRLRETVLSDKENFKKGLVNCSLDEIGFSFELFVCSLPVELEQIILENFSLLKTIELADNYSNEIENDLSSFKNLNLKDKNNVPKTFKNTFTNIAALKVKTQLNEAFDSMGGMWQNAGDRIMSIGKTKHDCCLLLNFTEDFKERSIWNQVNPKDLGTFYDRLMINGFQLAIQAGPICDEPVKNVMFCVLSCNLKSETTTDFQNCLSGTLIREVKTVCHKAFSKQSQRLMEPMYRTLLNVETSVLGKLSKSLYKRNGRITSSEQYAPGIFTVKAVLPVVDSFDYCNEIRSETGGKANPFLEFSHYEIIDQNPYDVQITNEEESEIENRANKLMNDVRKRKGLSVDEKIVISAEKQRTLNKKK